MEDNPIACTLTAADLRDRQAAWLKLAPFGTSTSDIPGGIRLDFQAAPGVYDSLATLVRLEGECCPWMHFFLEPIPAVVSLTISAADADGETAVRLAFSPLTSSLRSDGGPPRMHPAVL